MNARTLLPLAILPAMFTLVVSAPAAETPRGAAPVAPTVSLPDNEAQAKARAALSADDVKALPPSKPAQPTPQAPAAQAEVKPAQPEVKSASPAAQTGAVPVIAGSRMDNEAQAKARAALYADEVKALPPAKPVQPTPQAPAAQAQAKPAEPEMKSAPPEIQTDAVPVIAGPRMDNEAQAKARAALRQAEETAEPQPAAPSTTPSVAQPTPKPEVSAPKAEVSAPKPVAAIPAPVKPAPRKPNPLTAGMQAPALPTTPEQQLALDSLLQQYVADQISAAEYHTRRAEIMAGK